MAAAEAIGSESSERVGVIATCTTFSGTSSFASSSSSTPDLGHSTETRKLRKSDLDCGLLLTNRGEAGHELIVGNLVRTEGFIYFICDYPILGKITSMLELISIRSNRLTCLVARRKKIYLSCPSNSRGFGIIQRGT